MICGYCLESRTESDAANRLEEIERFIDRQLAKDGSVLFQSSTNGFSHLSDALNLPFSSSSHCDPALSASKSQKLTDLLIRSYHKACNSTGGSYHDYADILTSATIDGLTPLTLCLSHGQSDSFRTIMKELSKMRACNVISHPTFTHLLTAPDSKGNSPLQIAVGSGDLKTVNATLEEMQQHLNRAQMQKALTHHSKTHWNIFHIATQPKESKGHPNPFIIDRLHQAIYDNFNPDNAKDVIASLCMEINNQGYAAFHRGQPAWLQKLLEVSQQDPIKPSRESRSR